MRAYPALLKLAFFFKTSCFPGMGCFNANSQASLKALLAEPNVSFNFDVMLIGNSVLGNFQNELRFPAIRGILFL